MPRAPEKMSREVAPRRARSMEGDPLQGEASHGKRWQKMVIR